MNAESSFFTEMETYMMGLLRYGVLDEKLTKLIPSGQVDWDGMMNVASEHGILALVWDGICKLPKEYRPSRQHSINWGLSAQEVWDRYAHYKQVLGKILDVCRKNNIKLLLFKGIAQSELYPKPESRPFGDIDIYLFEDYVRGDELFAQDRVTKSNKRTGFYYEGVHIENHRIFLNAYTELQKNVIVFLEESLKDATITKDGYYIMSPIANIIYQMMHFLAHAMDVSDPVTLRAVVDFGITLKHYSGQIDIIEFEKILSQLKLYKLFSMMVGLSEMILGISFTVYSHNLIPYRDIRRLLSLIMMDKSLFPVPKQNFMTRVTFYMDNYQKYNSLFKYVPEMRKRFIRKALSVII